MQTLREFIKNLTDEEWLRLDLYTAQAANTFPEESLVVIGGCEYANMPDLIEEYGLIPTNEESNRIQGWDAYLFFTPVGKKHYDVWLKKAMKKYSTARR
jgi:hypothetical protein